MKFLYTANNDPSGEGRCRGIVLMNTNWRADRNTGRLLESWSGDDWLWKRLCTEHSRGFLVKEQCKGRVVSNTTGKVFHFLRDVKTCCASREGLYGSCIRTSVLFLVAELCFSSCHLLHLGLELSSKHCIANQFALTSGRAKAGWRDP